MKCLTLTETEAPPMATANEVRFPMGLLGFEHLKDYLLVANPAEEPFLWLQVKDNGPLAFVVVNPFLVAPDYVPDLPQADADFLEIRDPDDALLFNIVTLHAAGRATVNLKGPIVINRHTGTGKQVVLANASEYDVHYPLPVAEAND
jgi:flagellar assembly factor FliW